MHGFNRDDLGAVMEFFAEDAIYDEWNGTRSEGKDAIRQAFEPQFRGDFGAIRFETEDQFLDLEAGRALLRWTCTIDREGKPRRSWRGLDILHLRDGLITHKLTYAKAERLALATEEG